MKKENIKLKVILYFLLGLFLNYLGLIIGALWIKFKTKTNKGIKFKALTIGFGIYILLAYLVGPYILQPQIEKLLYSNYPELKSVKTAVESKYTDGKVGLGASWNKSFNTEVTTTTMTVSYSTKRQLSEKEMQDMGKLVCNTLQSAGKKYDLVSIISVQSFLPIDIPFVHFNKTFGITASCEDWDTKDYTNLQFPQ